MTTRSHWESWLTTFGRTCRRPRHPFPASPSGARDKEAVRNDLQMKLTAAAAAEATSTSKWDAEKFVAVLVEKKLLHPIREVDMHQTLKNLLYTFVARDNPAKDFRSNRTFHSETTWTTRDTQPSNCSC